MKTRIRTFLLLVGLALVGGSLLFLGVSQFEVTGGGITGHCSSVFSGPNDNASDAQHEQQVGEITRGSLWRATQPNFDDLCNSERDSRKHWMWGLAALGAALIGCAVMVFGPTKSSA